MDYLEAAKEAMKDGVDWFARGKAAETETKSFAKAQAYAAIAQVEQLKRIADALYISLNGEDVKLADILYDIAESADRRGA